MNKVEIITDRTPKVNDSSLPSAGVLVHRHDIASITKALLLMSPNRDFSAGVIALAIALGIEVTE